MPVSPSLPDPKTIHDLCAAGNWNEITAFFGDEKCLKEKYLRTALVAAVRTKHVQLARYLLDLGAVIGGTEAAIAARENSTALLELFVEYGWDVNSSIGYGDTILPIIVEYEDLVKWALDHGIDPNRGSSLHCSILTPYITNSGAALEAAARHGSIDVLNLLVERGAKLENSIALHCAAESKEKGRIPVMERLLQLGVDINGSDSIAEGYARGPPLFYAIESGNASHVDFILKNGGNPRLRNPTNRTALEQAELGASKEIVDLVKESRLTLWAVPSSCHKYLKAR